MPKKLKILRFKIHQGVGILKKKPKMFLNKSTKNEKK